MAYTAAVTLKTPKVSKLSDRGLALLTGSVAVSVYDATKVEITAITGRFKGAPVVILGGVSSNGYLVAWDATAKAIKAWYPRAAHTHDILVIGGTTATEPVAIGPDAVTLGKAAATNRTVAGIDYATKGGVVSTASAAGTEVANGVDLGSVQFVAVGVAP